MRYVKAFLVIVFAFLGSLLALIFIGLGNLAAGSPLSFGEVAGYSLLSGSLLGLVAGLAALKYLIRRIGQGIFGSIGRRFGVGQRGYTPPRRLF